MNTVTLTPSTLDPTHPLARALSRPAALCLKTAVLYLLVAIGLGIAMGASGNYLLRPVHVHVGLLGWVSLAIVGLVYAQSPAVAGSRLAKAHLWLHQLSLPVMMLALAAMLGGQTWVLPALILSELAFSAGVVAFAINLFLNLDRRSV